MLHRLADAPSTVEPPAFAGPDHPMRKVTVGVAFDDAWDATRSAKVANLFDGMAQEWAARSETPERMAVIIDALERAELPDGTWLELGAGTGSPTPLLQARNSTIICSDLSAEMLTNNPTDSPKVRCDGAAVCHPDDSIAVVVLVNMLLFPNEMARILAPDGVLLWINTLGPQTPIHLPASDVLAAMPGQWVGTTARAGSGFWMAARAEGSGALG